MTSLMASTSLFPSARAGTAVDYKEEVLGGAELQDGGADMGVVQTLSSAWKLVVRVEVGFTTRARAQSEVYPLY